MGDRNSPQINLGFTSKRAENDGWTYRKFVNNSPDHRKVIGTVIHAAPGQARMIILEISGSDLRLRLSGEAKNSPKNRVKMRGFNRAVKALEGIGATDVKKKNTS